MEARIQKEPEALLNEARGGLKKSVSVLSKLVRSGKLRQRLEYMDGRLHREFDESCRSFTDLLHWMNRLMVLHAGHGRPAMRTALFFDAKMLSEAFIRLAQAHPEDFISAAESSLTMPSVRARNPGFTADAETIVKAIYLGSEHPAADVSDNRGRAGAHSHLLVANILDGIHTLRRQFERKKESLALLQSFHETADEYRGVELEDYLRNTYHIDNLLPLLACAALPPWEENAKAWWKGRVREMVHNEFDEIARNPGRNPALWEELGKGGESPNSTLKDRRRYLEKLCRNKFLQVSRAAHRTPARGQAR